MQEGLARDRLAPNLQACERATAKGLRIQPTARARREFWVNPRSARNLGKYIKLAIWRRIIVPGSIRLGKLHVVLLLAMGWEDGHLHEFVFGENEPSYTG
jgi:hypothetical protein